MQDSEPQRRTRRQPAGRRETPYERLKRAIISGELKPAEPLVEIDLAEWCQVSRTPIREALLRLEQDGLVERVDRGLLVRERTPAEILDVYETRIVLEATAAGVAAERRSTFDLMTLKKANDRFASYDGSDELVMVDLNRQFHQALWSATHNQSLIDLLTRLDLHLARYPATTLSKSGRWEEAAAEHQAIVDAVLARDRPTAEQLGRQHFTRARDIRLAAWLDDQADL